MKDLKQKLLIEQIDQKLSLYKPLVEIDRPEKGWIYAVRTALGMSYRQLSQRLGFAGRSSSSAVEQREQEGSITLKSLSEAAQALDMKLVYGFVPKHGSLEAMIEKRARDLASEIVMQTSHTMALEDQENSQNRLKKAIDDRTQQIIYEMPKYLWD